MKEIMGEFLDEIKRIEREGNFSDGNTLPGSHEFITHLTDFERAICTYLDNILESEMDEPMKSFQAQVISGFMWFTIINNHKLWYKPNHYGVNRGKSLVIISEESIAALLGSRKEATEIKSIDDLPTEAREALVNFVMSSKSFAYKPSTN